MTSKKRATFSAAIKLETAELVLNQGYTQEEAAKSMGVGKSTVSKWVAHLRAERAGLEHKASPISPELVEIKELKKQIARMKLENEILKILKGHAEATALLMSDSLNSSR